MFCGRLESTSGQKPWLSGIVLRWRQSRAISTPRQRLRETAESNDSSFASRSVKALRCARAASEGVSGAPGGISITKGVTCHCHYVLSQSRFAL